VQVILAVDDVARAADFYRQAFGWPENDAIDYSNYVELLQPDGTGALGLYARDGFARAAGASPLTRPEAGETATEIYVRLDDARPVIERLRELSARELRDLETKQWSDEVAYFADPDGNVVAVAHHSR
jgi:uncharacterized glyoxalase superfamily protein PhnB